jgi:Xaa-Pro aminopeptidase
MRILILFLSLILIKNTSFAQENILTSKFHSERRSELRKLLPDSSVAVFFAAPVRNYSNDIDYQYHQDPDFYYLTGIQESDAMLLVFKETQEFDSIKTNEVLFIHGSNPFQEAWTGKRLNFENARLKSDVKTVVLSVDFPDVKIDFSKFKKIYHPALYNDVRDNKNDRGDLFSLIKHFKLKIDYENKNTGGFDLIQLMSKLREVKTAEEILLMRRAIKITCEAQLELMKALEPGMTEYQAQAIVEYNFKNLGSEYVAYPSIVGGGENSCVVHYTSNKQKLEAKDMLVVDAGAEFNGYAADVTRTLPVDGKFSEEEKIIYKIVLEAQTAGIKACRKGNDFRAGHNAAVAIVQKRLLEYGIIKESKDYIVYFFHGTSHYLGLDVHDEGLYEKLTPGNVITVEPGIYIPSGSSCDPKWWNIGVRIEDDVLITEGEPEVLSGELPKKIEEIEAIMQEKSLFNQLANPK